MTSNFRLKKKKRDQQEIQTPYLSNQKSEKDPYCVNYLLKMKYDSRDFTENKMIKDNFNVLRNGKFADPFLLQMSLSGQLVAGSDVRNLRPGTK